MSQDLKRDRRYEELEGCSDEPTRGRSELQERLMRQLEETTEMKRSGSPEDMPEIERELVIIEGALQGVEQRVAEALAHLRRVIPDMHLEKAIHAEPGQLRQAGPLETHYGRRLSRVSQRLSEVEAMLGVIQGARV